MAGVVWKKPVKNPDGTGYQESECGGYTIDKAFVKGVPRYNFYKRNPTQVLGCADSSKEAKALLENLLIGVHPGPVQQRLEDQ